MRYTKLVVSEFFIPGSKYNELYTLMKNEQEGSVSRLNFTKFSFQFGFDVVEDPNTHDISSISYFSHIKLNKNTMKFIAIISKVVECGSYLIFFNHETLIKATFYFCHGTYTCVMEDMKTQWQERAARFYAEETLPASITA